MDIKLSNRFQEIYNQLDHHLRKRLKRDENIPHTFLIKEASKSDLVIRSQRDQLIQFAQLRNAIVHNPERKKAHPIAEPHPKIVEQYEEVLNNVLYPIKAFSVAIPFEKIYTTSLEDKAKDIMLIMNEKVFTHVPVMENDKMIGVFSENVVFSYLVKNEIAAVDKDIPISEFGEFLPLDKHKSEFFHFVPRITLLVDIQKLFENELEKNRRLGVVFITNSGKQSEKLLGMITAWDIAGS